MALTRLSYSMINGAPLNVKDAGAKGDNTTDDTAAIQSQVDIGGGIYVPDGQYRITDTITSDYSDAPSIGVGSSVRYNIEGASLGNTSFSFDNDVAYTPMFHMIGDTAYTGQGVHGFDTFGNCNLIKAALDNVGAGIQIESKAFWSLYNMEVQGFDQGINIKGCVSSSLSNVYAEFNNNGIVLERTSFSEDNALTFTSCVMRGNNNSGIASTECGATLLFDGCIIEGNGTMGVANAGGVVVNVSGLQGNATLNLKSCYFEGNKGVADLYVNNVSPYALTVVVDGCTFNRISNSSYVTQNIYCNNTGGGTINLVMVGNGFYSGGTYVPSSSRPFVTAGTGVTVLDLNNAYTETTSKTHSSKFITPQTLPYKTTTQGGGGSFAIDATNYSFHQLVTGTPTGNSCAAPTGGITGQVISIQIKNLAGGFITSWTFDPIYIVATWVSLAYQDYLTIQFVFDGTNWVETSRASTA